MYVLYLNSIISAVSGWYVRGSYEGGGGVSVRFHHIFRAEFDLLFFVLFLVNYIRFLYGTFIMVEQFGNLSIQQGAIRKLQLQVSMLVSESSPACYLTIFVKSEIEKHRL